MGKIKTTTSKSKDKNRQRLVHGPLPDKSFGQHILKNPLIVTNMLEKANLKSTDVVLEIGPGTGNMTMKMLPLVKKVIAIELDPRMVVELQKRSQNTEYGHRLQVIHGDFMKVEIPYFDVCMANVPYNISSPLTFKLLSHRPAFRCAVLMFQREFVLRMVAKPGDEMYCRLSVNCQLLARCNHIIKVSRNSFRPPPKVESSVVMVEPRNPPPPVQFVEWDGLIKLLFNRKNRTIKAVLKQDDVAKTLESNMRTYCALKNIPVPSPFPNVKELIASVLEETGMAEMRAAKMDTDDYLKLLDAFNKRGVHFA